MAIFDFKLPDLGEGVVEGELVAWLVKEGDSIKEDQDVAEVMTDKATVNVPAPRSGKVLKLHGKPGDVAKVHHTLITLEVSGEEGATAAGAAPAEAPAAPVAAAAAAAAASAPAASSGAKVLATPVTRRMAREHGLDLAGINGSGPQGRVTKADVVAAIQGNGAVATGPQAANVVSVKPSAPLASVQGDQRVPLRGLRKKIAEKMVKSKTLMPHFTFVEEMDATELVALRKRINEGLAASGDSLKVSFLPFLVKALIAALRKFPDLNSNFDEASQELIVRGEYNIGIAASTPDGLTVPVVKHADRLSIRDLAAEIARLGTAAREKKLKMDELTGGTFTITSLGQTGGLFATPIINHPEVAILGVHRMRKRPVVVNDQIAIREMMNLSCAFDHRVIDGSVGAEFTYEIIRHLERPEMLWLEMT